MRWAHNYVGRKKKKESVKKRGRSRWNLEVGGTKRHVWEGVDHITVTQTHTHGLDAVGDGGWVLHENGIQQNGTLFTLTGTHTHQIAFFIFIL